MTMSGIVCVCIGSPGAAFASPPADAGIRAALEAVAIPATPSCEPAPWTDLPPLDGQRRTLMVQGDEALPEASPTPTPMFGAEGSTRWTVLGNFGVEVKDSANTEYGIGLGVQWFLVDDFAFAPALRVWGFSQEGENAFGGSLDLLFQWHFLKGDTWSLYGDFGCGMLGTNHNVPFDGSQFNFTPQAGLGVTFDVGQERRWVVGVRWHHISNATLYQNNPGRDSVLFYTGLSLPF